MPAGRLLPPREASYSVPPARAVRPLPSAGQPGRRCRQRAAAAVVGRAGWSVCRYAAFGSAPQRSGGQRYRAQQQGQTQPPVEGRCGRPLVGPRSRHQQRHRQRSNINPKPADCTVPERNHQHQRQHTQQQPGAGAMPRGATSPAAVASRRTPGHTPTRPVPVAQGPRPARTSRSQAGHGGAATAGLLPRCAGQGTTAPTPDRAAPVRCRGRTTSAGRQGQRERCPTAVARPRRRTPVAPPRSGPPERPSPRRRAFRKRRPARAPPPRRHNRRGRPSRPGGGQHHRQGQQRSGQSDTTERDGKQSIGTRGEREVPRSCRSQHQQAGTDKQGGQPRPRQHPFGEIHTSRCPVRPRGSRQRRR